MRIGTTDLQQSVYVIAEVGGNHNGDPELALRMVDEAASAGAHAVKFQTYRAASLVHPDMESMPLARAFYARQIDRFRSLELGWDVYEAVIARCQERGIDFMTTPFDLEALERLSPYMPAVKVASGDLTYKDMLVAAAATGKPVIVSTGMGSLSEIRRVLDWVPAAQLILLHCVSLYPTPPGKANLLAVSSLQAEFPGITIGYSDHTIGITAPVAAVALGARVIEKHFTLDMGQPLGDHRLSLEPAAMRALVDAVGACAAMRGEGVVESGEDEVAMRRLLRRGLHVSCDLPAGTILQPEHLTVIRPETAFDAAQGDLVVGRALVCDVSALSALTPDMLA